jgi:hypothetical protein
MARTKPRFDDLTPSLTGRDISVGDKRVDTEVTIKDAFDLCDELALFMQM